MTLATIAIIVVAISFLVVIALSTKTLLQL